MNQPTKGTYEILKVYQTHGIVKIPRGSYNESIHIRRLKNFHEYMMRGESLYSWGSIT